VEHVTSGLLYLISSGLLNVGWLVSLRGTDGLRRLIPLIPMILFGATSTLCLSRALTALPASIAYIVYSALSIGGSLLFDLVILKQPISTTRLVFLILIMIGIAGLQTTTSPT
jgi:quaternary ammonium compound-resistance protein SugE